jgi:hypothetical protein
MKALMPLILVAAAASSSAPVVPRTGHELIDLVVQLEGGLSQCVTYVPKTYIFRQDNQGRPSMLTPERFHDPEARAAAQLIAIDWRREAPDNLTNETLGKFDGYMCPLYVAGPAISGEFAFVYFRSPGGDLGVYAFRKQGNRWDIVERARLGFW